MPVTVKTAGLSGLSEALAEPTLEPPGGLTLVAAGQVRITVTGLWPALLKSVKTLCTVTVVWQAGSALSVRPFPSLSKPSVQVGSPCGPSMLGLTSVVPGVPVHLGSPPGSAMQTNDPETVISGSPVGSTAGRVALQKAGSGL